MDADYKYIAINHGNAVMIPIEDAKTGILLFNMRFNRGDEFELKTDEQLNAFSRHPEIEIKQVDKTIKVSKVLSIREAVDKKPRKSGGK